MSSYKILLLVGVLIGYPLFSFKSLSINGFSNQMLILFLSPSLHVEKNVHSLEYDKSRIFLTVLCGLKSAINTLLLVEFYPVLNYQLVECRNLFRSFIQYTPP